ncbi:MAG: zinc ribbon domain-containing protein [Chloroflexota bacterium]
MRRCLFALFLAVVIALPVCARAQAEIAFEIARVQIWPEYDQPGVLVIYDFLLSAESPAPADLSLRIPAAAGQPYVVAAGTTVELVTDQGVEYDTRLEGEWLKINIRMQAGDRAIRLEYYDPALQKQGADRQYVFTWPGDYATDALQISFQRPGGATAVQTAPPLAEVQSELNNLLYYEGEVGPLPAGQTFTLTIGYQKSSDTLTVSGLEVRPAGVLDTDTAGRVSISPYVPWVLGSLGVVLIGVGLFAALTYWQSDKPGKQARRKRHTPRREESTGTSDPAYCHQCGKRSQPGDAFCRTCGIRLRRPD